MIRLDNDGPLIASTNYWETPNARAGYFYLSTNARAFRLLVPRSAESQIEEMRSARFVVVSRGPWPAEGRSDALELLFDDGSGSPYALHLGVESADRLPLDSDSGRSDLTCTVWTQGTADPVLTLPACYRRVARIPDLSPWPAT